MLMQLHLFSSQGASGIENIVNVCSALLSSQLNPAVAYLPAAAVGNRWIRFTEEAFKDLAAILVLDPDHQTVAEVDDVLKRASVLYIPGGNTYVLQHRLQASRLLPLVQQYVGHSLPLVAFSAGTVLCGPNILTTNDMNVCASTTFDGLAFTLFNFNVHFPATDGSERSLRDNRVWEYHQFHTNSVLALEDDAYIMVRDRTIELIRGTCWRFDPGQERRAVGIGMID